MKGITRECREKDLKSSHVKKFITKTTCKTRIKGHRDGKEKENENVQGDAFDNIKTGLFKRGKEDTTGNLFSLALIVKSNVKGRSLEQCSPFHVLLKTA